MGGVEKWEGMVALARTGGAVELTWIRSAMLQPYETQEVPAEHGVSTGTT